MLQFYSGVWFQSVSIRLFEAVTKSVGGSISLKFNFMKRDPASWTHFVWWEIQIWIVKCTNDVRHPEDSTFGAHTHTHLFQTNQMCVSGRMCRALILWFSCAHRNSHAFIYLILWKKIIVNSSPRAILPIGFMASRAHGAHSHKPHMPPLLWTLFKS